MNRENSGYEGGFTLVELVVVMAISMFVLVAASKVMISMTSQFKQQTRISEKSIQSGVGLELLRRDIAAAGFGLPTGTFKAVNVYNATDWSIFNGTNPGEAITEVSVQPGSQFNRTTSPPRMVDSAALTGTYVPTHGLNGSSYFVIRSAAVGSDPVAGKFFLMKNLGGISNSGTANVVTNHNKWTFDPEHTTLNDDYLELNMDENVRVIVLNTRDKKNMGLMTDPRNETSGTARYSTTPGNIGNFEPAQQGETYIAYGINSRVNASGTPYDLRAPFNRVDYYVGMTNVPDKCATNTGVLFRDEMLHKDGTMDTIMVMDCVAMMQVEYGLDENRDGNLEITEIFAATKSAEAIRKYTKRIDVYILAHEGSFDQGYEYYDDDDGTPGVDTDGKIAVGTTGRTFDAKNLVGDQDVNGVPYWKHFRWRVYHLSERPVGKGTF